MPHGATARRHGQWHRRNSKSKREVSRWWIGGRVRRWIGRWGRSKQKTHRIPCVQRENDDRDSRVRIREAESRRTENRTAHRFQSPPAVRQVQLSPNPRTVRTRPPEADFHPTTRSREHARFSQFLIYTDAPIDRSERKKSSIDRRSNRFENSRRRVARTAGVATAVNVDVPIYRYINRNRPGNRPLVPLFIETKGSAKSSLIRTIDLLRRKYCSRKIYGGRGLLYLLGGWFIASRGERFVRIIAHYTHSLATSRILAGRER